MPYLPMKSVICPSIVGVPYVGLMFLRFPTVAVGISSAVLCVVGCSVWIGISADVAVVSARSVEEV